MANINNNANDNKQFWEWFFHVEEISEMPLEDGEAFVITHKAVDGDKRTYDAVHLKPTLQKRSS